MGLGFKITDKLELPKDLLLGAMNIYLTGSYEAYIENYKSIIEYNDKKISVRGKKNIVIINGKNLKIDNFTKTDMVIKGIISEVIFDK
ncbi:MAG: YabP/YqfC family sporulation protein [Lachnospiraceae bacterium]|nr:YabP/YqfC family sporulation protein [Lachnospiraceae bacterium]